jgi:L-threonylcarbamoyladenylate synthase
LYAPKERSDNKAMIILVADEKEIFSYVKKPDKKIFQFLSVTKKPTTVIYAGAKNVAHNLISGDGSIAIRIVKDDFCRRLIRQFKKPIVSTSANVSQQRFAKNFNEIDPVIKNGVDYMVKHRQNDNMGSQPSSIIKLNISGKIEILRP